MSQAIGNKPKDLDNSINSASLWISIDALSHNESQMHVTDQAYFDTLQSNLIQNVDTKITKINEVMETKRKEQELRLKATEELIEKVYITIRSDLVHIDTSVSSINSVLSNNGLFTNTSNARNSASNTTVSSEFDEMKKEISTLKTEISYLKTSKDARVIGFTTLELHQNKMLTNGLE